MRFIVFFCLLVLLASCTYLNGNVSVYRSTKDSDDKYYIYGAWKDSEKMYGDDVGIIRKQGEGDTERNQDSFTIYFNQAFFKNLPDFGFDNEVIVVFRFTEISGKEDGGEIVKILGPMKQVGDGSFFPGINKVSYGPKKLSSDVLSVNIQIIEYDVDEMENSVAFLDFITNAASTLAIADPITAGEIKVAKEIAKTLLQFNQNDLIMDVHFDLLPYDENVVHWKEANEDVAPIPLKTGNYVIIQEEQCRLMACYFQFSQDKFSLDFNTLKELPTYTLSFPADILAMPLVALNRTFFDTPDNKSLSPIEIDNEGKGMKKVLLWENKQEYIVLDNDSKKLYLHSGKGDQSKKLYKDKSWITFSIEQGRDPSLWEFRQSLSESEESINRLLKNRSIAEILESSPVEEVIKQLEDTEEKIKAMAKKKMKIKHIGDSASYIEAFSSKGSKKSFCVSKPKDSIIEFTSITGSYKLNIVDLKVERKEQTPISECYTIEKQPNKEIIEEGKYKIWFQVKETNSEHSVAQNVDYYFVKKPTIELSPTGCKSDQQDNKYELKIYDSMIDNIFVKNGEKNIKHEKTNEENSLIISTPCNQTADKIILKMKYGLQDMECTPEKQSCVFH